jgi:hypothetical protein
VTQNAWSKLQSIGAHSHRYTAPRQSQKPELTLVIKEEVLHLHIAVDETFRVQPLNDADHLVHDATALRGRHGPGRCNGGCEIHPKAVEEEVAVADLWLADHLPTDRNRAVPGGLVNLVFSISTPELEDLRRLPFDPVDHAVCSGRKFGHFNVQRIKIGVGRHWWPWFVLGQVVTRAVRDLSPEATETGEGGGWWRFRVRGSRGSGTYYFQVEFQVVVGRGAGGKAGMTGDAGGRVRLLQYTVLNSGKAAKSDSCIPCTYFHLQPHATGG